MVTAPVIHELGSPPPRKDSTGRVPFVFKFSGRPGRLDGLPARSEPLVQPLPILAAEEIVGVGDAPVERLDMSSTDADTASPSIRLP